ncbi:MAG: hypothetical protein BVN35_20335 [Proteobacteria bacterium ST_bin11]|nr:MAG: hypothetical protein BVN35_20335 [Proteobacteria bacterium ST_bin11]
MSRNQMAGEYRAKSGHAGGVVVVFNDEISGWMNELRDAQHWMPGCIAIDSTGNEWIATGGNDYDGATVWNPLKQAA